ncbi:MAG: hypothetical protein NWF01_03710 [Candidatus Bathyarchaeota archaeon]|nr:hypothetical protein [Candidatus Bathyarchaeota archaeon]
MVSQGKLKALEKDLYKTYILQYKASSSQIITLKDVPLSERHREAQKPLFLIRYE